MAGSKTHEQQLRILERKDDVLKEREVEDAARREAVQSRTPHDRDARHIEMAVSRGGMHQESRDHNKHNNPGQSGHKPQEHSPAEEKN
jgi:hypothetical protein